MKNKLGYFAYQQYCIQKIKESIEELIESKSYSEDVTVIFNNAIVHLDRSYNHSNSIDEFLSGVITEEELVERFRDVEV
jgi:hypothetical protein